MRINICLISDENFIQHLAVTMVSILHNTNRKCHFYVLNSDISQDSKNYLEQLKNRYPFDIEYIDIDKSKFTSFPNCVVPHVSKDAYYRLLIPNLVPSLEKVIYLDVDLVLDGDIEKLWEIDIGDNYIGAIPDQVGRRLDPTNYVLKLDLPKDSKYINSGVLVMNLKKLRQDKMVEKFFEVAEKYKDQLHFVDQDILTISCAPKIYYLRHYFNATPLLHYEFWNEKKEAFENPIIIHWAGGPKPWTNFNVPMKEYYYKYSRLLKNDK